MKSSRRFQCSFFHQSRTEERIKNALIMEDNVMKGLMRGSSTGTLSQNADDLIEKLSSAGSTKQKIIKAR